MKIQKQHTPYNMEISKSYKELLKNHFLTEADAIPKTKIIQKPQKTFRTIVVVILRLSREVVSSSELCEGGTTSHFVTVTLCCDLQPIISVTHSGELKGSRPPTLRF